MSADVSPEVLFECKQCGECCHGFGGTYVSAANVAAISAYIGADPDDFLNQYCQMSGDRPVLAQVEDGYCVFCKEGACTIHPVKPDMCRAWPFIKSILVDVSNRHTMARACQGMHTDLDDDTIREGVRRVISARKG